MASKESLITAEDFITLKKLVKQELTRRSNSKSVGSMSKYITKDWDYSVTPSKTSKILKEHINKITQPVDAVNGSALSATEDINATQFINTTSKIAELSGKAVTANSSNTGCKSSCSGLCSTGCYSSCSGCSTTCSGTCSGSCDGCDGSCSGTCEDSCGSACDQSCSPSCNSACSGSCSGGGCGSSSLFI